MFRDPMNAAASPLATPSGKHSGNENFPVGSFLIRPDLRPHVHAFYQFARMGDDIADNPDLSPEEKIRRLDRMAEAVDGADVAEAPAATRPVVRRLPDAPTLAGARARDYPMSVDKLDVSCCQRIGSPLSASPGRGRVDSCDTSSSGRFCRWHRDPKL